LKRITKKALTATLAIGANTKPKPAVSMPASCKTLHTWHVKSKRFERFITTTDEKQNGGVMPSTHIVTEKRKEEKISSCFAFLYDDINIEIERTSGEQLPDELPF
jgi:hypothetical protein